MRSWLASAEDDSRPDPASALPVRDGQIGADLGEGELHDGQSEPAPDQASEPAAEEACSKFVHLVGRDAGAFVLDPQGVVLSRPGYLAVRVLDGVLVQIAQSELKAFGIGVQDEAARAVVDSDGDPRGPRDARHDLVEQLSDLDPGARRLRRLGIEPRDGEQLGDEARAPVEGGDDLLEGAAYDRRIARRHRHLGLGLEAGERRAKLVGGERRHLPSCRRDVSTLEKRLFSASASGLTSVGARAISTGRMSSASRAARLRAIPHPTLAQIIAPSSGRISRAGHIRTLTGRKAAVLIYRRLSTTGHVRRSILSGRTPKYHCDPDVAD